MRRSIRSSISRSMTAEKIGSTIGASTAAPIRKHFAELGERLPTAQDRLLYALLRPQRLLELIYQFIVYDDGVKKIARYQQFFAVQATIDRVAHRNAQGARTGGVIWHTTGSGKSLTMVMLAKALALHPSISNPHVILVTDRVNLDDQIYGTFHACGKSVVQAESGRHLVRLVTGRLDDDERQADVITTVINKFDQAARQQIKDAGINIFVLVDESHRSQYGSMHTKMKKMLPNGCYIGFTGTPLTKREKSTAEKFGSFIHKYSMRQAVSDHAVVPLLYEGRIVEQNVDKRQLERWFERATRTSDRRTEGRSQAQDEPQRSGQRHRAAHPGDRLQRRPPLRRELARHRLQGPAGHADQKQSALKYQRYLRRVRHRGRAGHFAARHPRGHEEVDAPLPEIQAFWKQMMDRYGSEEAYNREMLASFGRAPTASRSWSWSTSC